jgi:hydroxyacylglutathione hydrolase
MKTEEQHFGSIWFIPGENSGKYPYCHSIYIDGPGILIDPASDRGRLKELRDTRGVKEVWLSHWHEDHFMHLDLFDDVPLCISREDAGPLADLESLMDAYGATGNLRELWKPYFLDMFHFKPRKPDRFLAGGQRLSLGSVTVDVLHTPGHTPGNLSFYFREDRVLFLADYDLTWFGPWYGDVNSSIEQTIASVTHLQSISADTWLTCHEQGVFTETPASLWENYLGVIDEREQKLLDFLQEPKTMTDIAAAWIIYGRPREPKVLYEFAERAMMGKHLERLVQQGQVDLDGAYFRRV